MSADGYREALEAILAAATPAGPAVGFRSDGTAGPLWAVGEPERAIDEVARIARHALGVTE